MEQIFVNDDDLKALTEHRARRDAQVSQLRAAEDGLTEQKRLAYEATFELPTAKWTPEHKVALEADIRRLIQEQVGQK